jgi:hypothetical protein
VSTKRNKVFTLTNYDFYISNDNRSDLQLLTTWDNTLWGLLNQSCSLSKWPQRRVVRSSDLSTLDFSSHTQRGARYRLCVKIKQLGQHFCICLCGRFNKTLSYLTKTIEIVCGVGSAHYRSIYPTLESMFPCFIAKDFVLKCFMTNLGFLQTNWL